MSKDYLIDNLRGMCRYGCRSKNRADYCTVCEAAERLEERPVDDTPDTDMREVRGSRSFRENLAREKGYDE